MKSLMLFLVLLTNFVLTDFVVGQQLPAVVDNSKWFPPVRSQETISNCTHFSLIYYLKSSIWNKKFNRDPKLEVNQFNHNFVWNQNMDPVNNNSDYDRAFNFLKDQGCATMASFPSNEQSTSIKPDFNVREGALAYKSKRLFKGDFFSCNGNLNLINAKIASLKDSLNQGKCFTLGIGLFRYFDKMTVKNSVYNCYPNISSDSLYYGHMFTIIGYNDTIKTASGRGAFQVINSNSKVAEGRFYLDYNWFRYATWQRFDYCFLEEDFSSQPKIVASIKLTGGISGKDVFDSKYFFVDTLINSFNKIVDFEDFMSYICGQNQVQVVEINNQRLKLRSKMIVKPLNNLEGDYELVSDLSNLSTTSNFKSASVVVFDPVSVNFIGTNNQSFYSYTRECKLDVTEAYLSFTGTGKKIIAKIENLSDTTIINTSFYTNVVKPVGNTDPWIYVKSCTSVLKRKLITFSVADLQTNTAPVFTQVPSAISAKKGESVSFNFKATDAENNPIVYKMVTSVSGASINSSTGLFQYQASQVGTPSFTVSASDGIETISTTFTITVTDPSTNPLVFTKTPSAPVKVLTNEVYKFQFAASGPEGKTLKFSVDPPVFGFVTVSINETTGEYSFTSPNSCGFEAAVYVSDGTQTTSFRFVVTVNLPSVNNPPAFTQVPNGDLTATAGDLVSFTFKATDPESSTITYSIGGGLGASIDAATGLFQYQTSQAGTFVYRIDATDGTNTVSTLANIKVSAVANNAPTFINLPGTLKAYVNKEFTYQFEATDKDGDNLTFSIQNPLAAAQISSSGKLTFKGTQVMTYRFTVVVSDNKSSTSAAVAISVDLVDDVEEIVLPDYSVSIYPNPVADNMNIKVVSKDNTSVKMTIYDIQGRAMSTVINECGIGDNTFNYEASALKSGVYICKFVTGNTVLQTIKIIKQ